MLDINKCVNCVHFNDGKDNKNMCPLFVLMDTCSVAASTKRHLFDKEIGCKMFIQVINNDRRHP
jgi:hypothetical protein